MTNDAVVSEAEVIQSRMEDYSMACLGSQALKCLFLMYSLFHLTQIYTDLLFMP